MVLVDSPLRKTDALMRSSSGLLSEFDIRSLLLSVNSLMLIDEVDLRFSLFLSIAPGDRVLDGDTIFFETGGILTSDSCSLPIFYLDS